MKLIRFVPWSRWLALASICIALAVPCRAEDAKTTVVMTLPEKWQLWIDDNPDGVNSLTLSFAYQMKDGVTISPDSEYHDLVIGKLVGNGANAEGYLGAKLGIFEGYVAVENTPGSTTPAGRAKLALGDEIISVGGQPVTSLADFEALLKALPEAVLTLTVIQRLKDNRPKRTVKVALGSRQVLTRGYIRPVEHCWPNYYHAETYTWAPTPDELNEAATKGKWWPISGTTSPSVDIVLGLKMPEVVNLPVRIIAPDGTYFLDDADKNAPKLVELPAKVTLRQGCATNYLCLGDGSWLRGTVEIFRPEFLTWGNPVGKDPRPIELNAEFLRDSRESQSANVLIWFANDSGVNLVAELSYSPDRSGVAPVALADFPATKFPVTITGPDTLRIGYMQQGILKTSAPPVTCNLAEQPCLSLLLPNGKVVSAQILLSSPECIFQEEDVTGQLNFELDDLERLATAVKAVDIPLLNPAGHRAVTLHFLPYSSIEDGTTPLSSLDFKAEGAGGGTSPFFPLQTGNSWTYRHSIETVTDIDGHAETSTSSMQSVVKVIGKECVNKHDSTILQSEWFGHQSYRIVRQNVVVDNQGVKVLCTRNRTAENPFTTTGTWDEKGIPIYRFGVVDTKGEDTCDEKGVGDFGFGEVTEKRTTHVTWHVEGRETVTVAAGTFVDCLKVVEQQSSTTIRSTFTKTLSTIEYKSTRTAWYAPDVGFILADEVGEQSVKAQESSHAKIHYTTELIHVSSKEKSKPAGNP